MKNRALTLALALLSLTSVLSGSPQAFATPRPIETTLKCDEHSHWFGQYEVYIDAKKATKESILAVLDALHFTGVPNSTNSAVTIVRSHSVNFGHVIIFTVGDYRAGSYSDVINRTMAVDQLVNELNKLPGVKVDCDFPKTGGVTESN